MAKSDSRRRLWGIIDQGVASGTSFILGVSAARSGTPAEFGVFAGTAIVYVAIQGAMRAFVCDPFVVRDERRDTNGAIQEMLGVALATALGAACALAALALWFDGVTRTALLCLSAILPILLYQDASRYALVGSGRPRAAALADSVMLGVAAALCIGLGAAGVLTPTGCLLVWGVGAAAGNAVVVIRVSRSLSPPRSVTNWWRQHSDVAPGFLLDYLLVSGARQLGTVLVAGLVGLGGLAALRGAVLLLGPMTTLDLAIGFVLVPEARARLNRGEPIRPLLIGAAAILGLGAAAWGSAVYFLMPAAVGQALLGPSWALARDVLAPTVALVAANGVAAPALFGLRAQRRAGTIVRLRALIVLVGTASGVVGAALSGARGFAMSQAAVAAIAATLWWAIAEGERRARVRDGAAPDHDDGPLILHVTEAFGGGVASAIEDYVVAIPEAQHVVLAAHRPEDTGSDLRDRVAMFEELPGGHISRVRAIRRLTRELRPSVVHLHSSLAGVYGRIIPLATRVVYTPHCYAFERTDIGRGSRWLIRTVEAMLARRTDFVAAVSQREAMLARSLRSVQAAAIVPNVPPQAWPMIHSVPKRAVVGMGRLCRQKDPGFFIEVVRAYDGPEVEWVWIGGGDSRMARALHEAGVRVTGWQSREDALSELGGAVAYLHTAAWEGAPITITEAIRADVPVIARLIGAIGDGSLACAASASEMANILARVVSDEAYRKGLIAAQGIYLETRDARHQRLALREAYDLDRVTGPVSELSLPRHSGARTR